MTQTRIVEWYELLLARHPGWRPSIEDITASNYEVAMQKSTKPSGPQLVPLTRPRAEFDKDAPRFDVVNYFVELEVPGLQRSMRLYDIVHMCRVVEEEGQRMLGTSDMLVVPRDRLLEFKQLTRKQIKADPRMPDWCMVDLAEPFVQSFAYDIRLE